MFIEDLTKDTIKERIQKKKLKRQLMTIKL